MKVAAIKPLPVPVATPDTPIAREVRHDTAPQVDFDFGSVRIQRQDASGSTPTDPAEIEADRAAEQAVSGLLVEDDAQPGSGQMRKTEFLDELQRSSCTAADAELARVGRSTEGCPFVERAFSRYRTMPAARVEQALRRYVDPAGVTGASDYIPLVTRRVAEGVARWATTGDMSGVPSELAGEAMGGGGVLGMLGGGLAGIASGIGSLLFKRVAGGDATPGETAMASSSLGGGAPLESGVRGRMESAFGHDFSRVRIHADGNAANVSSSLGARAFTLGGDIGFAAGEYRPDTLVGDTLIAHELAHVVQQSSGGSASGAVEEDADHSAVSAMLSAWTGAKQVARGAMPRLRSGLGLQRCTSTPARPTTPPTAARSTTAAAPVRMASTTIDHAQFSTASAAARALTDTTAKAAAMTTLVQQALAELNLTVVTAGTSSTSEVVAADYQPTPTINFDVHLNDKVYVGRTESGETRRSLADNAGFSFNRGRRPPNYSILGPKVLENGRVFDVRFFAEHELDVAQGMTDAPRADDADAEVRVWTNDFRRYFYQSLDYATDRPSFTNLAVYYEAANPPARTAAVQALVDLYQNPPAGVDADRLRSGFRNWMRMRTRIRMPRRMNGIPESMLGQEVDSRLVIDLTAQLPAAP